MSKKVYVIEWNTESGDRGVDGFWEEPLTMEELHGYFKENHPCDYFEEDNMCYIYWDQFELELQERPKPLPKSEWSEKL